MGDTVSLTSEKKQERVGEDVSFDCKTYSLISPKKEQKKIV